MINDTELQLELTRDLDRLYGTIPPAEFAVIVVSVEQYLSERLQAELTNLFVRELPGSVVMSTPYFQRGDMRFEIKVAPRSVLIDDTLGVAVLQIDPPRRGQWTKYGARLSGCGGYERVEVLLSAPVAEYRERVGELSQTIFRIGYAWLLEHLRRAVRALETDLANELYGYIRPVLACLGDDVVELFWFVVIEQDHGFYVFDTTRAQTTLDLLGGSRRSAPLSIAEMFAGLLTSALPFAEMHSRFAVANKQPLDVDLRKSEYLSTETAYAFAEDVLYERKRATLYPVVCEGKAYLLAAFPSKAKDGIVRVLDAHLQALRAIFQRHKSKAASILKVLETHSKSIPLAKTGELLGGFTKGLLS